MSRINITKSGYLQIDTLSNHIYEVPVDILKYDDNFINHLIEKNWFNEHLFFELIEKLRLHKSYSDFDFTKIIFNASEKFCIIKICTNEDYYSRILWLRDFEKLSNIF